MKRRCLDHDYRGRCIYMVTLVVEGRRKLLGTIGGRSDAMRGSADFPHTVLSPLGEEVMRCWTEIPRYHPEVSIIATQVMPDHIHGIIFVHREMEKHLGHLINGFKVGCNRAYRSIVLLRKEEATGLEKYERKRETTEERRHGMLFERGFNDRLLIHEGQLRDWVDYLADNPRRLMMKQEHPDLFRVVFGVQLSIFTCSAIGNRFLLDRPHKEAVQCSRSLTDEEIKESVEHFISQAKAGAVLVSPALSPGEKAVMHAAVEKNLPSIFLSANSFTAFTKPGGKFMEACASGTFLIISPWPGRRSTQRITRNECLALNDLAGHICNNYSNSGQ